MVSWSCESFISIFDSAREGKLSGRRVWEWLSFLEYLEGVVVFLRLRKRRGSPLMFII